MYSLYIFPLSSTTYDFVVLTSLIHPGKILVAVLQTGIAKDLSAPLRICLSALPLSTSELDGRSPPIFVKAQR
jgi:hypothetical protein